MPKTPPITGPPEPRTLFYPIDSEQLAPASLSFLAFLFIPFLLLLALIAPAVILYIPLCIIVHWLTGKPLTFNLNENSILPTPEDFNE